MAILRNPSSLAKRREWQAQSRQRLALERPARTRLQRELRRAAELAAQGFEDGREAGVAMALLDHDQRIAAILDPQWRRTFSIFGGDLLQGARSGGFLTETRDEQGFFQALMQRWIEEFGALKIQRVSTTTRDNIRDQITRGAEAGESISEIARRIREFGTGTFSRFRSLNIARTEIHGASNAASDAALQALDLPDIVSEWLSAEDERRRLTHRGPPGGATDGSHVFFADGQIRAQGVPFDVGEDKLLYPGDPSGSAKEVIACRCVKAAVIPEDA